MVRRDAFQCLSLCLILTSLAGFIQSLGFTAQPSDTEVLEGSESVVLKCKVDETVPIEWYKDNQAITEKFPKYTFIQAGLRIKPVAKSDAGTYYCKAGTLRSKKATLTVEYICKNGFTIKTFGLAFRGENFTMICNCPAVPSPSYSWKKDDVTLSFATRKKLIITDAQISKDDGSYVCIVESGGRKATSLPHNLDVSDCSRVKIVNPPKKETPFLIKKPLTINCAATGDPKPVISWYQGSSSDPMKNTSRVKILSKGTLHFTNMRAGDAGQVYKCSAKNKCDNTMTYTTKLVEAKIGKFPRMKDILTRVGGTITIRCDPPKDAVPAVRNVTWELGSGGLMHSNPRFTINSNTLTISKANKSDSGMYKCMAENMAGKISTTITVIVAIYPEVTLNPVNKTVIEGESTQLECKFSGEPKPVITWEVNGKTLPRYSNMQIRNTSVGSVLTINNAIGAQSGFYRCSAKLQHVTERTKEARLLVKENIRLEKGGVEKFDEGTEAKLICKIAAGTGPFDVHWAKIGVSGGLLPHMKVEGSKLIISDVKLDDTGNYTCHINNSFSQASLVFPINVYDFARITLKPQNVTVKENGSALFDCKASGKPKPSIMWFRQKPRELWVQVRNSSRVTRLPNDSLLFTNIQEKDQSLIKCIAGNAGYIKEALAFLRVITNHHGTTSTSVSVKPRDRDEHEADNMGKTIGIAVGCAGAYIILVIGLMIYCKGRRARQAKKKLIINGEDVPLKPADVDNVEVVKAPELTNARHYPRADLEALRTLGSGTYGNVFLAKASEIVEGESSSIVVVQSLTSNDEAVRRDFMKRMEMLSLKHENIAKLLGVCQEEEPMYLISEYPEQGDLKTVMRDSSTPLSPTQKLNICTAVASGMNYLTNHDHVHKDLAARNCLVNKSFHVKISFLSLNQGTYPKEYYRRGEELIPLRWMAPEALNGEFTDMSDVWSFGVLMWEVYSEGILPYEERPDEEVLQSVDDDLRLTKPEGCPGRVYKMMEKCWADDKEDRATFGRLFEDLSEMPRESDF